MGKVYAGLSEKERIRATRLLGELVGDRFGLVSIENCESEDCDIYVPGVLYRVYFASECGTDVSSEIFDAALREIRQITAERLQELKDTLTEEEGFAQRAAGIALEFGDPE